MEYEYLFSKSVYEELKSIVKGHVFCKVVNDTLLVSISTREGIEFRYTIENFSYKLLMGMLNPVSVCLQVQKKYKDFIVHRFMY